MSQDNNHDEWLSLIEISGPFLAVPVLKKAFPQGLEAVDGRVRKYLRQAYDEWCEARDNDDPQLEELHRAWIREVLARGLEYDEKDSGELLKRGEAIPATLHIALPEHGVTLSPDYALVNGQKALLLIQTYPVYTDLDAAISQQGWVATPAERMVQLCRATGCRLGLITNGERWLLIDAPVGSVVTYASWYARLWGQEPLTLQAFLTLLGIRRFFVDASEQLPALFDESLQHQEEVTDALGEQVRRAVEVLIQSLDKEDLNSARTLLQDVAPTQLYEAGLTIMMRLVFLLSAEERALLLMGDEAYEANYAISTLRMQLRKESDEVLERRHDAWARLLATFRAVYGGIEHEALRLPALGGSLFDPDRFPFLEGRPTGSSWRTDDARPLPIDNRTVLLLLEAIQQYQGRTLSYRALDVEQIGYVYEGLLERTIKRSDTVTVELVGGKGAKKTIYSLGDLEILQARGEDAFVRELASADALKRSESAIRKELARVADAALSNHLLTACHGDETLRDQVLPIANLLRTDPWGYPLVYAKDAFIVTTGSDRRETGTHYTPKSLTEAIVAETLTPVAYVGPAEGTVREQWALKSPCELLDLKICDPAMGSGAFLVQACRWLSDRLVESWSQVEVLGKTLSVDGEVLEPGDAKETLPRDSDARTVIARRLIAERCLYGVDLNPLAVELAKLSIWLVTLAKGRPFGFLDHNLRYGDSLLGIHRLDQLTELSMTPDGKEQQRLFGKNIEKATHEAIELRQRLRAMPIRDIHDVEAMARLDADARKRIEVPERIADAFIGEVLVNAGNTTVLGGRLSALAAESGQAIDGDQYALASLNSRAASTLSIELSTDRSVRRPFHWPLEFPEVFSKIASGFDAVIGNPPFSGGKKISGSNGEAYREFLVTQIANSVRGNADLIAYFLVRARGLTKNLGALGLVTTNSVSEGDTRDVGLSQVIAANAEIYHAVRSEPWHGSANVFTSRIHCYIGKWKGARCLDGEKVDYISDGLTPRQDWRPLKLKSNEGLCFQGSIILGLGFTMSPERAKEIITVHPGYEGEVLFPYLIGKELNSKANPNPDRWVINFWDWPESDAKRYPLLYEQVRNLVQPERNALKNNATAKGYREKWWQFGRDGKNLYHSVGRGKLFLKHPKGRFPDVPITSVISFATGATKYPCFTFVANNCVFANSLCVIASSSISLFACLSSDIHGVWAFEHGSRLKDDLRYAHGDIFETFPFPSGVIEGESCFDDVGQAYFDARQEYLIRHDKGMTKFYNDLHDEVLDTSEIARCRRLHAELSRVVLDRYGFDDIELCYAFHEVPYLPERNRVRYTMSEKARLEVLRRLAGLNRTRHELEASHVLQINEETQGGLKKARHSKGRTSSYALGDLFDGGSA